jgi:hypothetical protein
MVEVRIHATADATVFLFLNLVAADVRRLHLNSGKRLEPPDVGCYGRGAMRELWRGQFSVGRTERRPFFACPVPLAGWRRHPPNGG